MHVDDELGDELDDELDPSVLSMGSAHTRRPQKPQKPVPYRMDNDALSTYIYPTNLQVRDYQYNIVRQAFFHNTLVVLPTGLGKTFIASAVILNYTRWFPAAKIVFMAPTKPLVAQQIQACCGITGLPPSAMAILLDLTRQNRAAIWEEKQVFFTTPQVVENDLKLGSVDPKQIALLVIDEAHRAKKNYAYNNVVKFMDRFNGNYRILAMTATPASTVEGVQEIVDNLSISRAEVRTENSIDIFRYLKRKKIERFHAEPSDDIRFAIKCVSAAIAPALRQANEKGFYNVSDPAKINSFAVLDASRRIMANPTTNKGVKFGSQSVLQILGVAGQCLKRLNIYGIRSFYSYFKEKHAESVAKTAKRKTTTRASEFFQHPEMTKLLSFCEEKIEDPAYMGHEKLEIVVSEVKRFFETTRNSDSRVIVFSEFRKAALDIVRALEHSDQGLKPHIFLGQAKDSSSEEGKLSASERKKRKKADDDDDTGVTSSELAQLTGMSQKVQKETIKKFKQGEFNILVATSIGEEGLDIGEVDLIVCYDSTSSPIKNIQRMGRTGRNRDGKILLLFSGNEESKFDKAMGGYEYIQQHIMNGNLISLHDQNRLIPAEFTPTAEERFIEIPEENVAIKEMADDDEIIKIATKYMTGSTKPKGKAKSTKNRKEGKVQKKFFMPDDVETGFQSVSSMVRSTEEVDSGIPNKRPRIEERERDFLDSMLDSDDGLNDLDLPQGAASTEKSVLIDAADSEDKVKTETSRIPSPSNPPTDSLQRTAPPKILRQPQLDGLISRNPTRATSPSLGVRKRQVTVVDQLKMQKMEPRNAGSECSTILIDRADDNEKNDDKDNENDDDTNGKNNEDNEKNDEDDNHDKINGEHDNDDFSDDDEILALAWRTQSGDWGSQKPISQSAPAVKNEDVSEPTPTVETSQPYDSLSNARIKLESEVSPTSNDLEAFTNSHSSPDSPIYELDDTPVLTSAQREDLYMNYYVPVDAFGLEECSIPQRPKEPGGGFRGSQSEGFLRTLRSMETLSEAKAEAMVETYMRNSHALPDSKDIIDFE